MALLLPSDQTIANPQRLITQAWRRAFTDTNTTVNTLVEDLDALETQLGIVTGGTWTPAMSFGGSASGITYSAQEGRYTRIVDLVHFAGHITLTNNGSGTGNALITGLPFTAAATYNPAIVVPAYTNFALIANSVFGNVVAGSTTITLATGNSTTGTAHFTLTEANITNTANFFFSGFYFV